MNCESISNRKMQYYINNPGIVLIDLRNSDDYKKKHIRNSINVEYSAMKELIENNKGETIIINEKSYGKDIIFVFYCNRGSLSMIICEIMSNKGYVSKSLAGGFDRYINY